MSLGGGGGGGEIRGFGGGEGYPRAPPCMKHWYNNLKVQSEENFFFFPIVF